MINDEYKIYWIWLQQVLKYANSKVGLVSGFYNNIQDLYNDSEYNWRLSGLFSSREIREMYRVKLTDAKKIYERCRELGYDIITYEDEEYPQKLKYISNPPCVLYTSGVVPNWNDELCVSIVGTRSATNYGLNMAFEISKDLAKSGVIVVSGGAVGVDTFAHRGALQANGITVAVLACGLNYDYLRTNASLRNVIEKKGILLSEYPPDYPVYSSNFIIRNRIVSGMSACTVVVEAGEKSGSLITANLALEQNRDVYVIPPHNVNSYVSKGVLSLMNDGAKVVTDTKDIINEYNMLGKNEVSSSDFKIRKIKSSLVEQAKNESEREYSTQEAVDVSTSADDNKIKIDLSINAQRVYDLLKSRRYHIDELSMELILPMKDLLPAVTELELYGIVRACSGRMYEIT